MFAALAPVLFDRVPRKLLILTALFPFIAYWLIWGGSLWYVLGIILGPVIAGSPSVRSCASAACCRP